MIVTCESINCSYWWQDEGMLFPTCHFPTDEIIPAPCDDYEIEEEIDCADDELWEDDDNLETGFDPYEGDYTWDC